MMSTLLWLWLAAVCPKDTGTGITVVAFGPGGVPMSLTIMVDGQQATTPTALKVKAGPLSMTVSDGARTLVVTDVVAPACGFVDVVIDVDDQGKAQVWQDVDDNQPTANEQKVEVGEVSEPALLHLMVSAPAEGQLTGAKVFARNQGQLGVLDAEGILDASLPAGPTTLSIIQAGFLPRVVELTLVAGEKKTVSTSLELMAEQLAELTVRAPFIKGGQVAAVAERRQQKQLVEVLGAEQIKKSGDSDAAAALRRVTGVTVVGGRFVFVRGLGDRYSSTLVNGAALPSPEPERRVVPLDLFPSSLLDSMVVQKSWSADLPGEFGGGSVQLRTRSDPRAGGDKPLLTVGLSTGGVWGTMLSQRLTSPTGKLDLLGFDDGSRAVPEDIRIASERAPLAEGNALTPGGLKRAELERLGELLPPRYSAVPSLLLPSTALQVSAGERFDGDWGSFGVLVAGTWSQDSLHTEMSRQLASIGSGGDVVVTDDLLLSTVERSASLGGVLALSWQPNDDHQLRAVTMLNRGAEDDARIITGYDQDTDGAVAFTRLRYVTRQLLVQQLLGEHNLPWSPWSGPLQLRWRASYALANRDEPGQRLVRYDEADGGRMLLSDRSDGNQLLSSSLVDHAGDGMVALRLPFVQWGGEDGAAQVGFAAAGKVRAVATRRFKFLATGPLAGDVDLREGTPEQIFVPDNIGADGFTLGEATRNTDNHSGSSAVGAGFATLELPIWPDVVITGGVRIEASRLEVTTFELFNAAAAPVIAELVNLDVLPALALSWLVWDDLTLKAAVTRTVIRPELRELSPAVYTDVAGGRARFGNPKLLQSSIIHADVRSDLALSAQDGLSLALFGKYFDKPIESVVTSGADQAITADNVDAAINAGVEVEGRLSMTTALGAMGMDGPIDMPVLGGLWLGGNAALIYSRVTIGAEQQGTLTSTERSLEGQSPWVANLQLGSDDNDRGLSAVLQYNVFGPRIVEVGALGLPDAVEEPFHQVDVVVRQKLPWGLLLSVQARNLIDLPATRTLNGRVVETVGRGRALNVGMTWTW